MVERGLRLKLGAFIGGSLVVLAGLIVFFGRAPELFSNKASYAILFPEAPGIGPGTPIRKSGVRIGDVTSLDLDPDSGLVKVQIRVDRKYLPRRSEDAVITRGILNGDTAIEFIPRTAEDGQPIPREEEWPIGSDIAGIPPITPRSLLTPASGILANAQQSLERIVKAFEKLEKLQTTQPKLERALDEASETFKAVRELVPDAKKTLDRLQNLLGADVPANLEAPAALLAAQPQDQVNLRTLIRDVQGMIRRLEPEVTGAVKSARQTFDSVNEVLSPDNRKQLTELLKNVNAVAISIVKITTALTAMLNGAEKTIANLNDLVSSAGGVVADVRAVTKPLAARSEAIITSVVDSVDQLSKTLVEVRGLLGAFGRGNGSIQKLLTDPAVYQSLDEAAGSLARVMGRAEKITRDLEVFADKIARRPELIGVGGAIRPSSGLKDLPGTMLPAYRPDWPPALPARPSAEPNWLAPPVSPAPPPLQGYPSR